MGFCPQNAYLKTNAMVLRARLSSVPESEDKIFEKSVTLSSKREFKDKTHRKIYGFFQRVVL